MYDKKILIKRFKKSLPIYSDNAIIQRKMADTLLGLLPKKKYENVLEIGCGSGILTNKFVQKFQFDNYLATDIVEESKNYINVDFKQVDMDLLELNRKYDLIISNAAIQWSNDKEKLINKLSHSLNRSGIIAITTFGNKNMQEFKSLFNVGLDYCSLEKLESYFKHLSKIKLYETIETLQFKNLFDILKHIKNTGTNIFSSKKIQKNYLIKLSEEYTDNYNNVLTYNPVYLIFEN